MDGTVRIASVGEKICQCGGPIVVSQVRIDFDYREFDLRFKTDGSPDGPAPGTPVVIKAAMQGDRGFVIFSAPGEISTFIKTDCGAS